MDRTVLVHFMERFCRGLTGTTMGRPRMAAPARVLSASAVARFSESAPRGGSRLSTIFALREIVLPATRHSQGCCKPPTGMVMGQRGMAVSMARALMSAARFTKLDREER